MWALKKVPKFRSCLPQMTLWWKWFKKSTIERRLSSTTSNYPEINGPIRSSRVFDSLLSLCLSVMHVLLCILCIAFVGCARPNQCANPACVKTLFNYGTILGDLLVVAEEPWHVVTKAGVPGAEGTRRLGHVYERSQSRTQYRIMILNWIQDWILNSIQNPILNRDSVLNYIMEDLQALLEVYKRCWRIVFATHGTPCFHAHAFTSG